MIVDVRVIPKSSQRKIVEDVKGLRIYVNESPVDGKANLAVIKMLSKYYGVSKSKIKIIQGDKGRYKVIEIEQ